MLYGLKEDVNRNDLILEYLPLVKKVVKRIDTKTTIYEEEDLINIGVIGLIDAINKYNPSKKVPFEAYARIRIKGSIIDELRKNGPVSRNRMDRLNEYYDVKRSLEHRLQRTPTEMEICEELGLDKDNLKKIHETVHYLSTVSLDKLVCIDDGNTEFKDLIEDKNVIHPEKFCISKEIKNQLMEAVERLGEREQLLLNLYYVEELTMKSISYVLDISIPRVSQIHGRAILKIREYMSQYIGV